jgi:hypothetical protein
VLPRLQSKQRHENAVGMAEIFILREKEHQRSHSGSRSAALFAIITVSDKDFGEWRTVV